LNAQNSNEIFAKVRIDFGKYMTDYYFIHLDEIIIKNQDRKWIYLKFESMKILKELDEFIPGQLASKCFIELRKVY
jgi:hypothetical protein